MISSTLTTESCLNHVKSATFYSRSKTFYTNMNHCLLHHFKSLLTLKLLKQLIVMLSIWIYAIDFICNQFSYSNESLININICKVINVILCICLVFLTWLLAISACQSSLYLYNYVLHITTKILGPPCENKGTGVELDLI